MMQAAGPPRRQAGTRARLAGRLGRVRNRVYHRFFKFPHERRKHYETLCRGLHPIRHRTRRKLAARLDDDHGGADTSGSLASDGYMKWDDGARHPLAESVVREAREMLATRALDEMKEECDERGSSLAVRRLDGGLSGESSLLRFALDARVLATATAYLGVLPVLDGIYLWYSPNVRLSTDRNSSQLFHIDPTGYRELKMFVHVNDVTADNGPLTVVPAAASRKLYPFFSHDTGSIPDDEVKRIVGNDCIVPLTGPTGTVSAADTSTCFHFGSRRGSRERLLVHYHFMSPYVPRFPLVGRAPDSRFAHLVIADTPIVERYVLGCR